MTQSSEPGKGAQTARLVRIVKGQLVLPDSSSISKFTLHLFQGS